MDEVTTIGLDIAKQVFHVHGADGSGAALFSRKSHFNDLCALLGVIDPVSADPKGEWFTFEKGASKTSGGEGWADVWRKGCFAWEYKGPRKDLDKAFAQLLQYSVALENPPLLIVSDMDRIRIHTNWTNSVQEVHDFGLEDLVDGSVRERLKRAFVGPANSRHQPLTHNRAHKRPAKQRSGPLPRALPS